MDAGIAASPSRRRRRRTLVLLLLLALGAVPLSQGACDWLTGGSYTPKQCDPWCRVLPDYGEGACTACYSQNLEGKWDLVIDIPNQKGYDGRVEICCGEADVSGSLGAGVNDCWLKGDACDFTVTCEFSSLTGCPPGYLVMAGSLSGEARLTGTVTGCDRNGTFLATRTTEAPCRLEIPKRDGEDSDADAESTPPTESDVGPAPAR